MNVEQRQPLAAILRRASELRGEAKVTGTETIPQDDGTSIVLWRLDTGETLVLSQTHGGRGFTGVKKEARPLKYVRAQYKPRQYS